MEGHYIGSGADIHSCEPANPRHEGDMVFLTLILLLPQFFIRFVGKLESDWRSYVAK